MSIVTAKHHRRDRRPQRRDRILAAIERLGAPDIVVHEQQYR
jgi:hypothetical protein